MGDVCGAYRCLAPLQVSGVLEYAHANSVEPFLEPSVELARALLRRDAQDMQSGDMRAGATRHLVRNARSFVAFAASFSNQGLEDSLATAAAECAGTLSRVRASFKSERRAWSAAGHSLAALYVSSAADVLGVACFFGGPTPGAVAAVDRTVLHAALPDRLRRGPAQ